MIPGVGPVIPHKGWNLGVGPDLRYDKFCVAVAPATRTASILTQLVKGVGC